MSSITVALLCTVILHQAQATGPPSTLASIPLVLDTGFWFGNFTVGASKDLSLLIDTGSSDLYINPDLYQPSKDSVNLHQNDTAHYETAQPDGCGVADITIHKYKDCTLVAGLVAHNQTFGNIQNVPPPNNFTETTFQHDGIIGFADAFFPPDDAVSADLIRNLYSQRQVAEERFGLALRTDGTGRQVFGGVEKNLLNDELAVFDLALNNTQWIIEGGLSGEIGPNSYVYLDSGTSNIVGTPDLVRNLFKKIGIQYVEQNKAGCASSVIGYYPCDNPPKVAFQFGNSNRKFYIEGEAFKLASNGNNNCTATITGIQYDEPIPFNWTIGQSFFQGKYLDFDVGRNHVGIASLRD